MEIKELDRIKLIAIIYNDLIKKSDAIICLEGDDLNRVKKTVELFKNGWAKKILISAGYDNPPFCLLADVFLKEFLKMGIPKNKIIIEDKAQNTYEESIGVLKMAKKRKWKKIILVVSHFHQPRAYLTFLKAMKDLNLKIQIFNAPVRELSWFDKTSLNLSRLQLLEKEFEKMDEYIKKGHLATIKEVITYQKWKERQ